MRTEVTLRGLTEHSPIHPPRDAKNGYVAKIFGRAAGSLKFEREFFGEELSVLPGDEGLYECQFAKKGGCTRYYKVILSHPEHGLILSTDCEDEAPKIARLLGEGVDIHDAIEIVDLRPSKGDPDNWIFDAKARSEADAKQAAKSATIDSAIADCWACLSLLPVPEQKKVMAELRKRVSPPKSKESQSKESQDA